MHLRERYMFGEGGGDLEGTTDLPAREQGIHKEKLQWRACSDVPPVFSLSRRSNWKQTQSRTENLSATGGNPLLRALRDNRDKEEKPDPVKLIDGPADPSSRCGFWLQLWRASPPLSLLGTFTCLLGLSRGHLPQQHALVEALNEKKKESTFRVAESNARI